MKPVSFLKGFLKCSLCHSDFSFYYQSNDSKPSNIYICSGYMACKCNSHAEIDIEKMENNITSIIKKRLGELQLNCNPIISKLNNEITSSELDISNKKKQIQLKLDKLKISFSKGIIDKGKYRQYVNNLKNQLDNIKEDSKNPIDWFIVKNLDVRKIFDKADIVEKRRIVSLILDKVFISGIDRISNNQNMIEIYWNDID